MVLKAESEIRVPVWLISGDTSFWFVATHLLIVSLQGLSPVHACGGGRGRKRGRGRERESGGKGGRERKEGAFLFLWGPMRKGMNRELNVKLGLGTAAFVYLDEYKNPNLLSRLFSQLILRSKCSIIYLFKKYST